MRTVREFLADDPLPLRKVEHRTDVDDLALVPATIPLERTAQWLVAAPARGSPAGPRPSPAPPAATGGY
jgi:hypothetical protein